MNWTEQQIQSVWDKGAVARNANPRRWRKDTCGAWICRDHYGKRDSSFGWEIDHIASQEIGGTDDDTNLRPLHWKNFAHRTNGALSCPVTANGGINIDLDSLRAQTAK